MIDIDRILCPVDFSAFSRRALDHAVAMAKWYEARLTVLYVFANMPALDLPPIELKDGDRERLMTELKQHVGEPQPDPHIDLVIREAPDVRSEILDQIGALEADLLVMGRGNLSGPDRAVISDGRLPRGEDGRGGGTARSRGAQDITRHLGP